MVARLLQEPLKLTQENHPENAVPAEKQPTVGLGGMVGIGVLCSLAGMVLGSAALSTSFMAQGPAEVLSVALLIALAVSLLGGWIGAIYWMCREEAARHES